MPAAERNRVVLIIILQYIFILTFIVYLCSAIHADSYNKKQGGWARHIGKKGVYYVLFFWQFET